MKMVNIGIEGCFEIEPKKEDVLSGKHIKPYQVDDFNQCCMFLDIKEQYYSVSKKNVLRGMHFQKFPHEMIKLITCIKGKIFDVVVDLRKDSSTYLKAVSIELTEGKRNLIYVPKGLAHGFYTLSDEAVVLYMCSETFSQADDSGINWNSIDIKWPVENPVISEKDANLPSLKHLLETELIVT